MDQEQDLKKALFELAVREMPKRFVRDLLHLLPVIYKEAHARSYEDPAWEASEAHDLCGHLRRSLVEARLRKIASTSGIPAKAFHNAKLTSNYTLVRAGRLALTQSALQFDWQMARPAMFRAQHSAINRILSQPTLPALNIHPPEMFAEGEVYGIIFHGPQFRKPQELGFAVLGFPCSDSHRTLFRFPLESIAKAQSGQSSEDIIRDLAQPRLKKSEGILGS